MLEKFLCPDDYSKSEIILADSMLNLGNLLKLVL